jgi:hypothetical protein
MLKQAAATHKAGAKRVSTARDKWSNNQPTLMARSFREAVVSLAGMRVLTVTMTCTRQLCVASIVTTPALTTPD